MRTTATALEQSILYLAACGIDYQNELYHEIKIFKNKIMQEKNKLTTNDNNNGNDNINISDLFCYNEIFRNRKKLLIKLSSFIYEILRIHGGIVASIPRYLKKDVTIKISQNVEYKLYKGTFVFANLVAMNHNATNVGESNSSKEYEFRSFNPKRFIDENGENLVNYENISPFGIGRRDCAGQNLALRDMFFACQIFLISMNQHEVLETRYLNCFWIWELLNFLCHYHKDYRKQKETEIVVTVLNITI